MKSRSRLASVAVFSGFLAVATASLARAQAVPAKQSNAGDSISQGAQADDSLGDHVTLSWVQGTDVTQVNSIFERYLASDAQYVQEPVSVSGAEMVGGKDNFAAQASRICAQTVKATRVFVLLGGNDICSRQASSTSDATANLYTVDTWVSALRAGLDQLTGCLPPGARVQVMSAPRVDYLYDAGTAKSSWCSFGVWPLANVCRIITNESDATRRAAIGARINDYNDATVAQLAAYNANANGVNPNGTLFIADWKGSTEAGHPNSSIGTYQFGKDDINGTDCFHPNVQGQSKIACVAWATTPDGAGTPVTGCF